MENSVFKVMPLMFTNPDDIAPALQGFFDTHKPEDIVSITHFVVAVQVAAKTIALHTAQQQPTVEYQFRYIIVYT